MMKWVYVAVVVLVFLHVASSVEYLLSVYQNKDKIQILRTGVQP